MKKAIIACALSCVAAVAFAQDLDAILAKNEDMPRPNATNAEMKMTITNKSGQARTRVITAYTEFVDGVSNKQMMVFTAPADVRDTRFLSVDWKDSAKKDEQAIYMPALRKVRTIGTSGGDSKTGAFLGSDFTYADIGSLDRADFNARLAGEEAVGGDACWKVEYTPKTAEVTANYGYGKIMRWITKEHCTSRQSEFYDKNGKLVKRLEITGLELVDGKYWQFKKMQMFNLESGGNTAWEFTKSENLPSIDPKYFTMRFLERGR